MNEVAWFFLFPQTQTDLPNAIPRIYKWIIGSREHRLMIYLPEFTIDDLIDTKLSILS